MASNSARTTCIGWEDFLALHRPQLLSIGLPEHLWERLYKKLAPIPSYDASEAFELHKDEQFVSLGHWSLHARRALEKFGDVFLIEHAWSSDGGATANKSLEKSPELLTRVKEMLWHKENNPDDEATGEALLDSSLVLSQIGGINEEKAKEALEATDGDLIEALCQITDDSHETKKSSKSNREKEEYPESMGFGYGTTSSYSWSEEEEGAMTVLVSIPVTAKKRDVVNKLATKRWTLGLKGYAPIIDGEFYGNVCPDESFWTFDSPGVLVMTLQKPENEESELWPKILKMMLMYKYIKDCFETVFHRKRRVCLQYSVTVKSLKPLQLLIHNTPHVKVAEKEHDPNVFLDEYESSGLLCGGTKKNGTVNHKVTHEEFLKHLSSNYLTKKQITWDAIQSKIQESIAKLFYAVAPSLSAFQGRSGRKLCAVYGVDVLLKDTFEPLIIGINPTPKFDSQKCFADVLITAFGQNGECLESANISQISVKEG
ncbi:Protein BOBBER 1 [Stylophora pistillata]|uniref:Protein BOBBER 1 n=1 Tax=Stylophora pistillata TaxID=50429 RepID=A0A2B4RWN5_STYPI|nr:Protein BOBBER 1 [Stylophora pistillata]